MAKNKSLKKFAAVAALQKNHGSSADLIKEALALHMSGELDKARDIYLKILSLSPEHPDALHFMGLYCFQTGNNEDALKLMAHSIHLSPSNQSYYSNLGPLLLAMKKYPEAVECYQKALKLNPSNSKTYNNMGNLYEEMEDFPKAIEAFRKALSLAPDLFEAYSNIGTCFQKMNMLDEAEESYKKSLKLKPDFVQAHWNLSQLLMLKASFLDGLPEFEWRIKRGEFKALDDGKKRPDIKSDNSKSSVLVVPEQGFGDLIHFARFIPEYSKHFGKLIFYCHQPMIKLFKGFPGVDEIVARDSALNIQYDFKTPLLSIPYELTKINSFNFNGAPYLKADKTIADSLKGLFDSSKFNVGLVWAGNPTHKNDKNRSLPLKYFSRLAAIDNTAFYSIQKGKETAQISDSGINITNLDGKINDFSDTAAIMHNLDLVISVDSAPLHLAGALGIPAWGLIPFIPDWRWQLGTEKSIWYDSVKLFRQPALRDWDSVFEKIAAALADSVSHKTSIISKA